MELLKKHPSSENYTNNERTKPFKCRKIFYIAVHNRISKSKRNILIINVNWEIDERTKE